MGLTYAELTLTNLFDKKGADVSALVDTDATFMCVTEETAAQLARKFHRPIVVCGFGMPWV